MINGNLNLSETEEIKLRPYQLDSVEAARNLMRKGATNICLCAPTGSGKSVIACHVAKQVIAKGGRVAFVTERLTILDQITNHFNKFGIAHGVVQGSRDNQSEDALICSMQTLQRRGVPQNVKLLIFDECHVAVAAQRHIIDKAGCRAIGLTATPFTNGMDKVYDGIVNVTSTNKLVKQGFLTTHTAFIASEIDTSKARIKTTGEWNTDDLGQETLKVVGDIAEEWRRRCKEVHGRAVKTIAFVSNVASCQALIEEMATIGAKFKRITYLEDNAEHRRAIIKEFENGKIDGLVSVDALGRGFDVADVECVILAAPIRKSFARFIQQLGRGLRPAPGKKTCLVNDHSGNFMRFSIKMERFFEHGHSDLKNARSERRGGGSPDERPQGYRQCPECNAINTIRAQECHVCGALLVRVNIKNVPGEMTKYIPMLDRVGDVEFWEQCCLEAQIHFDTRKPEKGTPEGRAKGSYKGFMGIWPKYPFRAAKVLDREVANAIKLQKKAAYAHFEATGRWD